MQACFIGHRVVENKEEVNRCLKETVLTLIKKGVKTFLFGRKSEFDNLSWEVVTELKKVYPYIKRIYFRSAFPNIDKNYENYLLNFYEESYFPPKLEKAGKCAYIERNYEMINNSTYCVFYYNENYCPKIKGKTRDNNLLKVRRNSGTKIAYKYALKNNKQIINVYR